MKLWWHKFFVPNNLLKCEGKNIGFILPYNRTLLKYFIHSHNRMAITESSCESSIRGYLILGSVEFKSHSIFI